MVIVGLVSGLLGFVGRGWWTDKNVSTSETKNEGILIIGVIDGDTIVTENKVRVRLRHIDAPELENCGGPEAKKLLEEMVLDKRVEIKEQIIDQKGRPMGLIWIDDALVNKRMLAEGWARYHSDTTTVTEEMKQVTSEAKAVLVGLWGRCRQTENLTKPKCNIKGNIDPNNTSLKIYQMPGCVQYKTTTVDLDRGEEWFCTESEAKKAGYVKSKRCGD